MTVVHSDLSVIPTGNVRKSWKNSTGLDMKLGRWRCEEELGVDG